MGIQVPGDRTTKQPATGYCLNPACRESSTDERFVFSVEHDHFGCPKCGNDSPLTVGLLTCVHFLIADNAGKIQGSGQRYRLACDASRAYLATVTNNEAATGLIAAVNCVGCLAAAEELGLTAQGWALKRE